MNSRVREAIEILEAEDDEGLQLDKSEVEERLSDLEQDARTLTDYPVESLPGKIEELADAIHSLYADV